MVKKTMAELVKDLSSIDGSLALKLDNTLKTMKAKDVTVALQDTDSDLYKNIPVDMLRKSPQGKQYLELLAVIQPAIGERIQQGEESDRQEAEKAAEVLRELDKTALETTLVHDDGESSNETTPPNNPFASLFAANEDNKMLMDLANEISNAVNYEPSSGIPNTEDFMDLMTRVSDSLQERIDSGQLDINALETQARGFMERMQSVPEVANMMQNPQFIQMLSGMTQ